MRIKKHILFVFLLPCLLLFALIYLLPIGVVAVTSFTSWKIGTDIRFCGVDNYLQAVKDPNVGVALLHTLFWVVLQATVHVALGVTLALILSRRRRGWRAIRTISMIPNIIPASALAIIFLRVFDANGLMNSLLQAVTGKTVQIQWYFQVKTAMIPVTLSWLIYSGLITILVLAAIMGVSSELSDSAKIDGARGLQIDFLVILPIIRNTIGTAVIIAATSMLKEFELIFLTTNGGPGNKTLNMPLYLYKTSLIENNYGYGNAMGVMLIVLGVGIVFAVNKLFRMDESVY